jgi:hypothetical protein
MFYILILFVGLFIWYMVKNKIHIDLVSFLHKTLALLKGKFGVYCFTGHQGSGKTYALNKYIRKHAKGKLIYSNITLLDIDYIPITSAQQLFSLIDVRDCIIVFDELFSLMKKSSKIEDEGTEFLSQMRKQHIIFLTTVQYWLELPIHFRRFVRIMVECETRPMGELGGIITETYYDATKIKWDNMANEYVSPLISTKISKYEKRYMITYDTEERVRKLKR